ncbi:hypothetical protein Q4232_18985, partial [Acinetobacter baumannii]
MKDLNVHENIDEIGVRAAQLSSFIVVLTGAAIICISATKSKAGLSVVMKDLFPSNIYVLVALMVMSFILCTFSLLKNNSVHDKFHRTLILSGFCLLKIAKISLNSSFFPKPIKR